MGGRSKVESWMYFYVTWAALLLLHALIEHFARHFSFYSYDMGGGDLDVREKAVE